MPRQFDSYEDAKQYYDAMEADRKRWGALNSEIRNLENELNNQTVPLSDKRKAEINEELAVYTRVRDNIGNTFQEKYDVNNINQLAIKMRKFEEGLELMARHGTYQDEYTKNQSGQSGQSGQSDQGQPTQQMQKTGYDAAYDNPSHHDRPNSPGRGRETDFDRLYDEPPDNDDKSKGPEQGGPDRDM